MATFTQQITNYAGDVSSYSTEIDQWLDDGVKDVIRRTLLSSPEKASLFASNVSFSTTLPLEDYGPILDVTRDSRPCAEIPANLRHQSIDSGSIYLATANDPVFYKLNGELKVVPSSSSCQVSAVRYGYVSDSAGTILFFPDSHLVYVVYFASANALHAKLVALTTGLTGTVKDLLKSTNDAINLFKDDISNEIDDHTTGNVLKANNAITKANNYLSDWNADGDAMNTDDNDEDRDFEFMMFDEDTEIASLALNGAQTQLNIAQIELGKITSLLGSSANYLQVAQSYLGEATNRLNKDQMEYQWLTSQLAYVKGQYDAAFSEGT
tara:strand:+ start:1336 stop:2307 length:972 start_codon:yes stop_codon:yes gene_type:complete